MPDKPLVLVESISKHYPVDSGLFGRSEVVLKAVDRVDLDIARGETMGLVGESGSGKTTLGRCMMRLIEPTAGRIIFDGRDLRLLSHAEMREVRRDMQIVFQDPIPRSIRARRCVRSSPRLSACTVSTTERNDKLAWPDSPTSSAFCLITWIATRTSSAAARSSASASPVPLRSNRNSSLPTNRCLPSTFRSGRRSSTFSSDSRQG